MTEVYDEYWRSLLELVDQDGKGIQELRDAFDFPAVAQEFRVSEHDTDLVIVHYLPPDRKTSPASSLLERLRNGAGRERELSRLLKGYIVHIYRDNLVRYQKEGLVVAGYTRTVGMACGVR